MAHPTPDLTDYKLTDHEKSLSRKLKLTDEVNFWRNLHKDEVKYLLEGMIKKANHHSKKCREFKLQHQLPVDQQDGSVISSEQSADETSCTSKSIL